MCVEVAELGNIALASFQTNPPQKPQGVGRRKLSKGLIDGSFRKENQLCFAATFKEVNFKL